MRRETISIELVVRNLDFQLYRTWRFLILIKSYTRRMISCLGGYWRSDIFLFQSAGFSFLSVGGLPEVRLCRLGARASRLPFTSGLWLVMTDIIVIFCSRNLCWRLDQLTWSLLVTHLATVSDSDGHYRRLAWLLFMWLIWPLLTTHLATVDDSYGRSCLFGRCWWNKWNLSWWLDWSCLVVQLTVVGGTISQCCFSRLLILLVAVVGGSTTTYHIHEQSFSKSLEIL